MPGCCDPQGYDEIFGPRFARRQARRYRKRGLGATERDMVAFLAARGVAGASVLEIGGGVGELQLELLRRGAERATNLELVAAYDGPARELAREAGVDDRIERRLHDIVAAPDDVDRADIVVLHRVVCCHPDYERLLGVAADHATRLLVFSHPPRNLTSRAFNATQNAVLRLTGHRFQTFTHPPDGMLAVLRDHGLTPVHTRRGLVWHVVGLVREPVRI
ncbi:magnesium-protoporphyrin O-methyltransferase [Phycicoccus badiiscoriae]|uniref:Magnesium-protoporphyrin O-methyltransferase n=1 Tax=Pedococcus badiiscoriae TaxID=642776 RepID=A0A852WRP6_9MICO|nr:methyltransferase domain-containing protein [Pedococcus badiiscoriae]NYG07976.1 magnesium-protoporphyrin O-methyltransferase [Pedococcus badiiscoriae]